MSRESGETSLGEAGPPVLAEDAEANVTRAAVRATLAGDRDAFHHLVRLYERRLFGLVLMVVRDGSGAEEVTQDAFLRAFTHLNRYDMRRPFYPWLATIAVRLAQTWLRRQSRRTAREGAALVPEMETPSGGFDPFETLVTDESGRRLWRLVEALPSGERTVVVLYYRRELKLSEIAHALGVTTGTVKTLLFRARRRLRSHVERLNRVGHRENLK